MTEKQLIRAKALEIAVLFLGIKPNAQTNKQDETFKDYRAWTEYFERYIHQADPKG